MRFDFFWWAGMWAFAGLLACALINWIFVPSPSDLHKFMAATLILSPFMGLVCWFGSSQEQESGGE